MQKFMITFSTWIFGICFAVAIPLAFFAVHCAHAHDLAGLAFCKFISVTMLVMIVICLVLAFASLRGPR